MFKYTYLCHRINSFISTTQRVSISSITTTTILRRLISPTWDFGNILCEVKVHFNHKINFIRKPIHLTKRMSSYRSLNFKKVEAVLEAFVLFPFDIMSLLILNMFYYPSILYRKTELKPKTFKFIYFNLGL